MRKVVRQAGFAAFGEPVAIDNNVYVPLSEEEKLLTAEEKKAREIERKTIEEQIFRTAVEEEVKRIVDETDEAFEEKREKIINDAIHLSKSIIDEADKSAEVTREKTELECEQLKKQAIKDGHDEGYKAGFDAATQKCKKYIDGVGVLMAEINSHKEAYYISNEKELRDTLFLMVQKIVKEELDVNPLVVENIIADAAKGYRNSDYLKISISECGITEKIKTDKNFAKKLIPFIKDIEFEILHDAPENTIILDDDKTIVDASVPTQLDFLKEILKNTRGEE